jgi:Uma2 family endonuclease
MAAAPPHLMTVEEFEQLPDPPGGYLELRHGEPITVTRPKYKHWIIQNNLVDLLRPSAEPGSRVGLEMPFRPLPDHECWAADVAYLSAERARAADPDGYILGAPELVIEVLSPSNTVTELIDREQISLMHGAREFWVVDPDRSRIKVTTRDGRTVIYGSGEQIPLPVFGPGTRSLRVDDVFRF